MILLKKKLIWVVKKEMKKKNKNIICNLFKVGFQILENSYSAHAPPSIILTSAALITFWGRLV
jgi:hypothetical protein